jgi:hypothetical protein
MTRARQIISLREAQAASERSLAAAQQAAGVEWKSASAEREKVVAQLNAYEQILARTSKNEAEYNATIKANAPALKDAAAAAKEYEINIAAVAPRTAAAAKEAEAYAGAVKKLNEVLVEGAAVTVQTDEAMLARAAAYEGSRFAAERAADAQRAHTTAVQQAESANQDFGTSLDYVAQKVVENGGTLTTGQQIWLTVAQATDEATASLYRYMEASRALTAQQTEALDAVRGWTDYVIALKEGYDSGVTSLGSYIQQLIAFKAQLTQMFAGATGDAKEALNAMQDLIQKLIATAGAGGRDVGTGNRVLDDLNRAIAAEKARRGGQ